MEASQETCFFLDKNKPQVSLQIIKRYVPKKKASIVIFDYFFSTAYVKKLERYYIDVWGSGGDSPQTPATFQRIR